MTAAQSAAELLRRHVEGACGRDQGQQVRTSAPLYVALCAIENALTDHAAALLVLTEENARLRAETDGAYLERNQVVAALARTVIANGGVAGVARTAIEGWSEDWQGCVYVELPTGQASWHFHDSPRALFAGLPPYVRPWDGHTTPEKYDRLAALAALPTPARGST
jgi:hypothetical protein